MAAADSGKDADGSGRDEPGGDNGGDDRGGKDGGGDDKSGHDKDTANGGEDDDAWPPVSSPISGFHSMFNLPLSPVLDLEDLPPSRFGSMEPGVTQAAPSTTSSAPITAAGPSEPTIGSPSSIPIIIAGPNEPAVESPSIARKRDKPDGDRAPEDNGPSTRAKRARNSSGGVIASLPMAQNKAKKPVPSSRKSISTTTTTPSPPKTTSDPSWLKSAISMVETEELGGSWSLLVEAWLAFERKGHKQTSSILNSTYRPPAIRDWIQRARSVSYRPVITSTVDFEEAYMSWWKELQPPWRMSCSGEIVYSKVDGDWGGMRTAGRNGLLSVVAALFFWGVALKKTKKTPQEDKGWKVGTDDCLRVLNGLLKE